MSEQSFHISEILSRHFNGSASDAEELELKQWINSSMANKAFYDNIQDKGSLKEKLSIYNKPDSIAGWNRISKVFNSEMENETQDLSVTSLSSARRIRFLKTAWFRYAAVIILMFGIGTYLWFNKETSIRENPNTPLNHSSDISAGGNKAILTIGNNEPMNLASNKTGITVNQSITYNDGEKIADAGEMLQLATPRGGQYQAVLPDGSKVWLNAASSIKFPSKFNKDTRQVEITGEVYMEIAKNTKQPFIVRANGTEVQVLGTSFNINAYADEPAVKTTLVEGSIKIDNALLKPGQSYENGKIVDANVDQDLAWKNGTFNFQDKNLQEILRQLARWYDLDIQYEEVVSKTEVFEGKVQRSLKLADVLYILEKTQVHFRMEGRKLIVLP